VTNALAAIAAGVALEIPLAVCAAAVAAAGPAFGRQEQFTVEGRAVRIWLSKNPAGLNEIVRALLTADRDLSILAMLNDGIQDGRDVSWIYDADLERLRGRVSSLICAGDRADDLALRFSIAGIEADRTTGGTATALDEALGRTPTRGTLDIVATYTAMIDIREVVAARAGVGSYWTTPEAGVGPSRGSDGRTP
jgi:UDP-N-acetylmuramyl tripeptide synthase